MKMVVVVFLTIVAVVIDCSSLCWLGCILFCFRGLFVRLSLFGFVFKNPDKENMYTTSRFKENMYTTARANRR